MQNGVDGVGAAAEQQFRKAIEVAQQQNAKSLELRATISLSRLWQHQGKTAAARQPLAKIYGWFTEGFDTADLKAAKALLDCGANMEAKNDAGKTPLMVAQERGHEDVADLLQKCS